MSLPQRVLFITSSYPDRPGSNRGIFILHLAVELAQRGIGVDVLTPRIYDDSLPEEETVHGRVFRYRFRSEQKLLADYASPPPVVMLSYLFSGAKAAVLRQREGNCDLLHGHWVLPTGVVAAWAARRTKCPLVLSSHGSDLLVWARKPLLRGLSRWTVRQAQVCTANSQPMMNILQDLGGAITENSLIFETGVDINAFYPCESTDAAKSEAGLDPKRPILLYVGNLVPRKGIDLALEGVRILKEKIPSILLVVAGEGSWRPQLEEQVARQGIGEQVLFLGSVPNTQLPPYYRACDLLVLPSRGEGMGVVLLEAAACGKAVVSTEVGGIPSVVETGTTGLLTEPEDPEALAEALRTLLVDPGLRREMGEAARGRAEREFSRERQVDRMLEVYRQARPDRGHLAASQGSDQKTDQTGGLS